MTTGPNLSASMMESAVIAKVSRRILPLLFVLYIVSYLDRANIAFAKLSMTADLHFSEAVFGLGAGLYFVGYIIPGLPATLIAERSSTRLWLSRILIAWGALTVLTGFVKTPTQLYTARFLLGIAEAGFFPIVITYISHWFPASTRAKAFSGMILAVPVSFVLGAPISAWCLSISWFGLPGWRWIFILQGLPAVLFGLATPFCITDRPEQAEWLQPHERTWISSELQRESKARRSANSSIRTALTSKPVFILGLALCLVVLASYGYIFWLPTTIQRYSGRSTIESTLLAILPFLFAALIVHPSGRSSDRRDERRLHTAVPLFLAGCTFALSVVPGQPFAAVMFWLTMTGSCLWAWAPPFWVLPTLMLGESAVAAAIGLINSIGNLGGFLGPTVVGYLITSGHSYPSTILFLCICFITGGALVLAVPQSETESSRRTDDDAACARS